MNGITLAEVMDKRERPAVAAAVYEFAMDQFQDFAALRVSLAAELVKAKQVEDIKQMLSIPFEVNPDTRLAALDHPRRAAIY